MVHELFHHPIPLTPDRFTPLARTPWAGAVIGEKYKKNLVPGVAGHMIGESWEFSCDPAFPSQVSGLECSLPELVARDPVAVLSPELVRRGVTTCEILLKLINAAEPLSLQVHPDDADPALKPGECGKPESWLVLDREPGAGLYLGFSRAISKDLLRQILQDGDKARGVLQFVPVEPGDYFDLSPGVPHAIGAGVTLLEPQRIRAGFSGKTYRLWDWGRRYDAHGRQDPQGQPRELHVEESLRIIDPERQVGPDYLATIRRQPHVKELSPALTAWIYPENSYYQLVRFKSSGAESHTFSMQSGYGAALVLHGEVQIKGRGGRAVRGQQGQPLLLPFASWPLTLEFKPGADLAIVVPSGAGLIT